MKGEKERRGEGREGQREEGRRKEVGGEGGRRERN